MPNDLIVKLAREMFAIANPGQRYHQLTPAQQSWWWNFARTFLQGSGIPVPTTTEWWCPPVTSGATGGLRGAVAAIAELRPNLDKLPLDVAQALLQAHVAMEDVLWIAAPCGDVLCLRPDPGESAEAYRTRCARVFEPFLMGHRAS